MSESHAVLPGALEPMCFFGRTAELQCFRREARSLAQGCGRSRLLYARPGSGKTELLRQWHREVYQEGQILPFWYSVPRDARDPAALAIDLVSSLSLQSLAFRRRAPELLARTPAAGEIAAGLRSSWGAAGTLLAETLAGLERQASGPFALASAAMAPHRLAALSGTKVLCLIDDIGNLAGSESGFPWPEAASGSAIAPAIFTLDDASAVPQIFGPAVPSLITADPLAPLSTEALSLLAGRLSRSSGLELSERTLAAVAAEAAGSPYYVGALVRALAARPGSDLFEVSRAAAASLCEGELARYWIDRLAFAIPDRGTRATALEVLAFCIRAGDADLDAGRLPDLMLKPRSAVESALAGLARAGVVRVDFARVVVDGDPVFREVVRSLYRREFGRVAPAAIAAALASDKVRGFRLERRLRQRALRRGALGDLLGAWNGQGVPAILFDATAFSGRFGGKSLDEAVAALAGETKLRTLPRFIATASGRIGGGEALPDVELDAVGWTVDGGAVVPEAERAWVARLLPGGAGSAEQLARFENDVDALQAAGVLPAAGLVRWAVLEAPLDQSGASAAVRLRLLTSTRQQFEALAKLVGVPGVLPPEDPVAPAEPELVLEMVIPRAADVELVAARALEQLAENLAVDAVVIGRLKVALVEACINAFEHGGGADGRVRLMFAVDGRRLVLRVENRGRPLAALPAPAAPGREAGGRGWGLTLIRELVDEVSLEPREDGACLLMVKYLERGEHG